MNSITKSAVFAACMVASVNGASATNEHCEILDEILVEGNAIRLPADVALQVMILQSHGDRYAQVIDLIIEENAKPEWAFTFECTADIDAPSGTTIAVLSEPWFVQFAGAHLPPSSRKADERLTFLFDADRIRSADPASLEWWYTSVIADPMTSEVMHLAGMEGIDAVLEGLLDTDTLSQFVATLEPHTAQPFFAILFHPEFLKALIEQGDARRNTWSLMVDTLEGLYPRKS